MSNNKQKHFTRREKKKLNEGFATLLSPHAYEKHKQIENNFEEYLKEYNNYELLPTNKYLEFKSIGLSEKHKLINVLLTNNIRYKINNEYYDKFKKFIEFIHFYQFYTTTKFLPQTFYVNENYDFINEFL